MLISKAVVCSAPASDASADVDWELLALLEQTEAALSRSFPSPGDRRSWPDLSLPDGLDLSHPGDFDWVCRVAEMNDGSTSPGWTLR
jgi:hypothetical protein